MSEVQGKPVDRREPLPEFRAHTVGAIADVAATDWDACANPSRDSASAPNAIAAPLQVMCEESGAKSEKLDQDTNINPFISHDFLSCLEASGSVGGRSGWHVQHLLVKSADG